jgi:hypothetical protein
MSGWDRFEGNDTPEPGAVVKWFAGVLIAAFLIFLFWILSRPTIKPAKLSRNAHELASIYQEDNAAFFDGKLPKQVTFSYVLIDPTSNMAETTQPSDGWFNISIDPKWMEASMTRRLLMFHEECHVYVDSRVEEKLPHGKMWRACMLQLEMRGAFRNVLVYSDEDKP